jgi:hypothetical protein
MKVVLLPLNGMVSERRAVACSKHVNENLKRWVAAAAAAAAAGTSTTTIIIIIINIHLKLSFMLCSNE